MTGDREWQFAAFVKTATVYAKRTRKLTVPDLAAAPEIPQSTIYRWLRAENVSTVDPAKLVKFCEAAGVDPAAAFRIMWPFDSHGAAIDLVPELAPIRLDRDIQKLQHRLDDPDFQTPRSG